VSTVVTARGSPPCAPIRKIGSRWLGENRMISSRFQLPPLGSRAVANTSGGPPDNSILFSLPAAQNPMERPLGDQNGNSAPSVLSNAWESRDSRGLTQRRRFPAESTAVNARL